MALKRGKLSRDAVLRAAVSLVDREGIEALSMRRLGAEVGVEAMSLYNHVPNKEALLDGMVETILKELEPPEAVVGWEERLRAGYRSFRALAHEHPNIFPLLINRPPRNPDGLWLFETFLETMQDAGFSQTTAFHAFRVLTNYTFGYAMSEIRGFALEPESPGPGGRGISSASFPHAARLAPYLEDIDHDAEFEFGLNLIIDGLEGR